jgi:hypothetical protein
MEKPILTQIAPGLPPDYPTERTGRCRNCNIRFIWPVKIGSLKNMVCPICYTPLSQTTHLFKGKTYKLSETKE